MNRLFFYAIIGIMLISNNLSATTYYLDPEVGNDSNKGISWNLPWKTLDRLNGFFLKPGDTIALAAGKVFMGSLQLKDVSGTSKQPIVITSFVGNQEGTFLRAEIDARGFDNGIYLENCSHLIIRDISIKANGREAVNNHSEISKMRCGLLYTTTKPGNFGYLTLDNLKISEIFYENPGFKRPEKEVKTANGTQNYGWGIRFISGNKGSVIENIVIKNSIVKNVGHTGIKFTGVTKNIDSISLLNNRVFNTGGPAIQFSGVTKGHIKANLIDGSGSTDDSRKWGRGSGLWTWNSSSFVIEKNQFLNAKGPGDSAGVHIDFYCSDVIVQYNLSVNNEGGFCEILGDNYNCSYRYNISINDGYRIKGKNGAFQEGKIFWLSGYRGNRERNGPFNSYFYNNTIYVKEGIIAKIAIDSKAEGILIANNIFYTEEEIKTVLGDQYKPETISEKEIDKVIFNSNLFLTKKTWPKNAIIQPGNFVVGDPEFKNKYGNTLIDFVPGNEKLIRDNGMEISKIPGDSIGLRMGLKLDYDILGNPIKGKPDLGAIEIQ